MPSRKLFDNPYSYSYGKQPIKIRDICESENEPDYQETENQKVEVHQPIYQNRSKLDKNPYYKPPQRLPENEPLKLKSMNKYFPNLDDFDKSKPI